MSWDDENFEELKQRVGQVIQRRSVVGNYVGPIGAHLKRHIRINILTGLLAEGMGLISNLLCFFAIAGRHRERRTAAVSYQ